MRGRCVRRSHDSARNPRPADLAPFAQRPAHAHGCRAGGGLRRGPAQRSPRGAAAVRAHPPVPAYAPVHARRPRVARSGGPAPALGTMTPRARTHGEEGEPMRNRLLLGIGTLLAIAGLTLGTPAAVARADTTTQTGQAGAVTIKATWQGVEAGPVFTMVLDTHAVNLDSY